MVIVTLFACAPQLLSPSLDVRTLDGLAELPADATVVGGGELAVLFRHPLAVEFGVADVFDEQLMAAGFDVRTDQLDRALVGCGTGGCVGVVDGDLSLAPDRPRLREYTTSTVGDTFFLKAQRGPGLRVRVGARRARVADAPAWEASGFDADTLIGAIPDGDAFVYVHDASRFLRQAAARATSEGTAGSRKAAGRAERLVPAAESAGLRAIAVSLDVSRDSSSQLRVRYAAESIAAAIFWQAVIEEQGVVLSGVAEDVWARGSWVRVGETVEFTLDATAAELRAIRNGE